MLWLRPASALYKSLVSLRNHSYNQGWKPVCRVSVPVVSVGNITMGGTGKTPLISHFVDWALAQKLKVGIVSRGYGGRFKGVHRGDLKSGVFFGDEPMMLATKYPEVPVYVCPDRVLAAETLLKENDVDFILADDAFQHRRLHRDVDLVILDATEKLDNYSVLPEGRAREPFQNLARAHYVILNKVNLASKEQIQKIKEKVASHFNFDQSRWLECNYHIDKFENLESAQPLSTEKSVLLVSGIGKPEGFKDLVRKQGYQIKDHMVFKDHHFYTAGEARHILESAQGLPVLTTEKDIVKLAKYDFLKPQLNFAKLQTALSLEVTSIYDEILGLVKGCENETDC